MIDIFLIMTSIHLDNHDRYNEFNPGIAIRHEQVVTGVYHNSFYDKSAFVAWDMNWKHDEIEYGFYRDWETDRKSTRLNSSHSAKSRMPSSA